MDNNEALFPLRPFKEIRKLYNAMVAGNWVTLTYRTDAGMKQFEGFVASVGNEHFTIVESLENLSNPDFMTYTNLVRISVGYVLQHGQRTVLSTISAEREKLMDKLFDDMLLEECADVFLKDGNSFDTSKIYSISLTGIVLTRDKNFVAFDEIAMVTPCQRFEE